MIRQEGRYSGFVLRHASIVLFLGVFFAFGLQAPVFLEPSNLLNILVQSSSAAITATGMTFVLLTAGIDLSVGSVMFVSAALAGKVVLGGGSLWLVIVMALAVGIACGAINAVFITRLRIQAFIATLAGLYLGRGLGLWITQTRAMNLPESLLQLGTARPIGIPVPVIISCAVLVSAHLVLTRTPFGRQIYAIGNDREAAEKAGIAVGRVVAIVYMASGLCAALGGLVSVAQLGAVSPTFGNQREFAAIAAAVLGGTSLFGGRGRVFPGTVLGSILIQTVENGLVIVNANPYVYPLIMSTIIFIAVFTDSARHVRLQRLSRRYIRPWMAPARRTGTAHAGEESRE
jgi:ribose transport system permease protein